MPLYSGGKQPSTLPATGISYVSPWRLQGNFVSIGRLFFASQHCKNQSNTLLLNVKSIKKTRPPPMHSLDCFCPSRSPTKWKDISIDFITHLPPSHWKTVIWAVMDWLTKYVHFLALPTIFTTHSLAIFFSMEKYCLHGVLNLLWVIVIHWFSTNYGRLFSTYKGMSLSYSSGNHPQSDSLTEVLNQSLEAYLHCFVSEEPQKWTQFRHLLEFRENTSFHSSIAMTPFEALYGRPPLTIPSYLTGGTKIATLDVFLAHRQAFLTELKD